MHHGLSEHADAWLAHCEAQCQRWSKQGGLSFASARLASRPQHGESIEAWARRGRYRALRTLAIDGGADLVLLGHHRRDQAETFVLQALRSGGVAALSAMPRVARRDGVTWARPWLDVPASAVEAHARRHRLRWIDDDSNADTRHDRNRLRLVWPTLLAAFPEAETTLANAARRAQQAAMVVSEVAADDLAAITTGQGLAVEAWRRLSLARQVHALRNWLRSHVGEASPDSLVERLLIELDPASARRWPAPKGQLHCHRGMLKFRPASASASMPPEELRLDLRVPGLHDCPSWSGAWFVENVDEGGLPEELAAAVTLRPRRPGDRFQAGPGRPPRSLKLQFQAAGVAEVDRAGPVACVDGRIVFVAGLGIDARARAEPGRRQLSLTWLPRSGGNVSVEGDR